jgi:hypothetical protein
MIETQKCSFDVLNFFAILQFDRNLYWPNLSRIVYRFHGVVLFVLLTKYIVCSFGFATHVYSNVSGRKF